MCGPLKESCLQEKMTNCFQLQKHKEKKLATY